MLRIITTTKSIYNSKSEEERCLPETLFLCKDERTNLCSIYFNDICYGEDIDERSIDSRIESVQRQLETFKIATNADILAILNS